VRDRWVGHVDATLSNEQLVDHVVLRPLCAALGLPIQDMTVPQANQLAREIGEALKSAVAGIMDAHKRELSSRSHLAETHLHAIEDNPLRLDQSADDAIRDLFMAQSPVHLSASAAIGESLTMLRLHQEASEAASEAALEAVLKALAPLALAKRFMKYKGHAPRSGDLDAWHWNMYQHYYAELKSEHQGGLSRMFWEVYAQVYDREMRHRTLQAG
jgi:type VI secretion system protein ImpI